MNRKTAESMTSSVNDTHRITTVQRTPVPSTTTTPNPTLTAHTPAGKNHSKMAEPAVLRMAGKCSNRKLSKECSFGVYLNNPYRADTILRPVNLRVAVPAITPAHHIPQRLPAHHPTTLAKPLPAPA